MQQEKIEQQLAEANEYIKELEEKISELKNDHSAALTDLHDAERSLQYSESDLVSAQNDLEKERAKFTYCDIVVDTLYYRFERGNLFLVQQFEAFIKSMKQQYCSSNSLL